MVAQLIEGFDTYAAGTIASGVLAGTEWNTSQAAATMATTTAVFANGRACLSLADLGSSAIFKVIPDNAIYWFGYRAQWTGLAANVQRNGVGLRGATSQLHIAINNLGQVVVIRGGVVLYTSAVTVPVSTWVYLDALYNRTAGTLDLYISNTFVTQVTGIVSIGAISQAAVGTVNIGGGGGGGALFFDDIVFVSGGVRYGEVGVVLISPTADQPGNDWTLTGGASGFGILDNTPPVAGQYIEAVNVGDISDFTIPALPVGVFQVFAVKNYYRSSKTTAGTADVRSRLLTGATTTPGATNSVSQTNFTSYFDVYDLNPGTGLPFVPADFAAANIKIGYERVA